MVPRWLAIGAPLNVGWNHQRSSRPAHNDTACARRVSYCDIYSVIGACRSGVISVRVAHAGEGTASCR